MNTNTIIALFRSLKKDYKIDDETAIFILKWFLFQDKLEHTEDKLKILIELLHNFYPEGVEVEDLIQGEITLSDILLELGLINSDERDKYER